MTLCKRRYLSHHSAQDKGGDPATFRNTRAAFEVLRNMFQENSVLNSSFASYFAEGVDVGDLPSEYFTVCNASIEMVFAAYYFPC